MDRAGERRDMVRWQLSSRGIVDPAVLRAMTEVPREAFVPEALAHRAFEDGPLAIGEGQTISQPYIVALMTQALALKPTDRVLEVGTGSGYGAAVLGSIAREVHTVERHAALAESARERLDRLGFDRVHVHVDDGTLGYLPSAPYDAISVTAGGPSVPDALLEQLAPGGRLVIPVGPVSGTQRLLRIVRKSRERFEEDDLGPVLFVPLIGAGFSRAHGGDATH